MKKLIKKTIRIILSPFILKDYFAFKKSDASKRFSIRLKDFYPQIKDKTVKTGFDRHYVYHTSWAARKVKEINPIKHIDISSSLYFCGIVSAFTDINFYDYRPADLHLSGLKSLEGNLHSLPFETNSVGSISCMHTIEHIGLGRYGDSINSEGDIKAIDELKRVVQPKGSLLFVTPVGQPKIEFNAHRIYSYEQIISYFDGFELKEFSLIPESGENGGIIINANPDLVKKERYACGCFWFIKKQLL
jgi:SAM-dependent methyltransferase